MSDNLSRTGLSFAIIFISVAAIVCYTSFTRIIQDRRAVIGVQKANGLRVSELLVHYLLFCTLPCVVPGVLAGLAVGYAVFQPILISSYMTNTVVDTFDYAFLYPQALLAALVALGVIATATTLAVVHLIRQPAVELMRGQPMEGHGIARLGAWLKRKGASMRTSILLLNLRSDMNRMFSTILCIAGCTGLIVIALSTKFGVERIPDVHYEQIFKSDTILTVDDSADLSQWEALLKEQEVAHALPICARACAFRANENDNMASMLITSQDNMSGDIELLDPYTKQAVLIPDDGILLSVRTCEYYGIEPGDSLELTEADGASYTVTLKGVIDNYIDHLIVMQSSYYTAVSGKAAEPNQFYLRLDGKPDDALIAAASQRSDYISYTDAQYKREQFDSLASSMNMIITFMIGFSIALAIVVLYQLVKLTLNKKSSELSVMYANGFSKKELRQYLLRDNGIMTVLGLLLGVWVGIVIARYLMGTMESDTIRILREANLTACLLAVGLTALFSGVINNVLLLCWKPRETFLKKMRQWIE